MKNETAFLLVARNILLKYKKNVPLRIVVILFASFCIWLCITHHVFDVYQNIRSAIAAPIIVGLFEYMTLNVIFDREFYPLDLFADDIFSDRESFGYKALYICFYIIFWVGVFYYLSQS